VQARAGGDIAVRFRVTEKPLATPAGEAAMAVDAGLRKAQDTIANDPEVQQLVDIFDAEVVPDSVRPVQSDE